MTRTLHGLVLVTLAALSSTSIACEIQLESGVYACVDGRCPPSMECDDDKICRDPDAPGLLYDGCLDDDGCREGSCFRPGGAALGICSTVCFAGDSCTSVGGAPSVCAVGMNNMGACANGCAGDQDCADGLDCVQVPMTMGAQGCYPPFPGWSEVVPCTQATSASACGMPEQCLVAAGQTAGVCAAPCGQSQEACPGTKLCESLTGLVQPFARAACVEPCTPAVGCGDPSLSCVERTPGGEAFCLPTGIGY